jgi:hypothetical protein
MADQDQRPLAAHDGRASALPTVSHGAHAPTRRAVRGMLAAGGPLAWLVVLAVAAGQGQAPVRAQDWFAARPPRVAAQRPPAAPGTAAAEHEAVTYLPGLLKGAGFVIRPGVPEARGHYVAASAAGGDGSFDRPWTLQEALNHPAALKPGETVWLRGGTYAATHLVDPSLGRISFLCNTHGSQGAPIVFRNYRGERAVIDGENNSVALFVQNCSHTWFWGLEVMSSAPVRSSARAYVYVTAPDVKFINMILHDMADGIDLWTTARNAELYGSIIYHNGWDETNGGHGHGIYTQNDLAGTKRIHDNIFFSQYGFNVRAWSTNQYVDNFDLQGNIAFNGGSLSEFASRKFNLFVVSNNPKAPTRNLIARHNFTFAGRTTTSPPCNTFGPNYGVINMLLEDNYLLGQFRVTGPYISSTITSNKILGGTALPFITGTGYAIADFPNNTYSQEVPTDGVEYFVRPNKYEPGRAHIAIYNWARASTVTVHVAGVGLIPGDRYELINVMDYFNDRVVGTFPAGGDIPVAMTGHTFAQAIGSSKPPVSQFPEFGAFVIQKTAPPPSATR